MPHKDKERAKEYSRNYYLTHKEQAKEYHSNRMAKIGAKEQKRAYDKEYVKKNKVRLYAI